jgi:hypothetical protein
MYKKSLIEKVLFKDDLQSINNNVAKPVEQPRNDTNSKAHNAKGMATKGIATNIPDCDIQRKHGKS